MATLYPTSIDSKTNPTATTATNGPTDATYGNGHAAEHIFANDAIEALEAKVGVNGSAVQTSHDFKLGLITGANQAASKAYVDAAIVSGGVKASSVIYGISRLTSDPSVPTAPIALNGEEVSATPGNNIVVRANASGKLPSGWGGSASGLATLDGSSLVVQNPTNATATPTASKIPIADTSGTLNSWVSSIPLILTAGATINGATLPVPVYQDSSTGKILACIANNTSKMKFIGFATTNSTDTNPITIQTSGVVAGFTGLTAGSQYFVQDVSGTIGLIPGTSSVLVGTAVSTTQILIMKGKRYYSGIVNITNQQNATTTVTCGFRIQKLSGVATLLSSGSAATAHLEVGTSYNGAVMWVNGNYQGWSLSNGTFSDTSSGLVFFSPNGIATSSLTISNVTETTFDVVQTASGTGYSSAIAFIVEGEF